MDPRLNCISGRSRDLALGWELEAVDFSWGQEEFVRRNEQHRIVGSVTGVRVVRRGVLQSVERESWEDDAAGDGEGGASANCMALLGKGDAAAVVAASRVGGAAAVPKLAEVGEGSGGSNETEQVVLGGGVPSNSSVLGGKVATLKSCGSREGEAEIEVVKLLEKNSPMGGKDSGCAGGVLVEGEGINMPALPAAAGPSKETRGETCPTFQCVKSLSISDSSLSAAAGVRAPSPLHFSSEDGCGLLVNAAARSLREETWVCAICHNVIPLAETAQVKGCDHPYCANCILRWCSYKQYPWCPQCRTPFSSLLLFKQLDGSLSDSMVEESVCLLLRAPWYVPLDITEELAAAEAEEDLDEEDYDEDEYYRNSVRLGNRRWGENGYVRGGRMQARVAAPQVPASPATPPSSGRRGGGGGNANRYASSPSVPPAKTGLGGENLGRRAKRAQKREQTDMGASTRSGRQQMKEKPRRGGRLSGEVL